MQRQNRIIWLFYVLYKITSNQFENRMENLVKKPWNPKIPGLVWWIAFLQNVGCSTLGLFPADPLGTDAAGTVLHLLAYARYKLSTHANPKSPWHFIEFRIHSVKTSPILNSFSSSDKLSLGQIIVT